MPTDFFRSTSLLLVSLRFALYATAMAVSALAAQASQDSGLPYPSHFVRVRGVSMHYVEVGQGNPILLLHGNPASAYIWRNVIPLLISSGRVIAVDLVGFGKSGKPNIDYRLADHATYLEGFIQALGLRNITLVLHDWGSALGFDYASRHPENVCALAFFEALFVPLPPLEQWPNQHAAEQFRRYRTPGLGWELIVNQNEFIEKRLQQGILRRLTEEELRHYREPFKNRRSRKPIWRWPNELPIAGDPPDVAAVQANYLQWLMSTNKPKLLLFAHPGALTPEKVVAWARANLQNLETVDLGSGIHNLQEDHPKEIGEAVAQWLQKIYSASKATP